MMETTDLKTAGSIIKKNLLSLADRHKPESFNCADIGGGAAASGSEVIADKHTVDAGEKPKRHEFAQSLFSTSGVTEYFSRQDQPKNCESL